MRTSKMDAVYSYAEAYESIEWETASAHAWDRLDMIAAEYQRDEYGWDRAKQLVDETREDVKKSSR
jgi:hypothetical protein